MHRSKHVTRRSMHLILLVVSALSQAALGDNGKLTVRVVDDATGKPLAARLVLQTSDGKYPGDRLAATAQQWPHIEAHGVFIDGEQTFEVPEGKTSLTAAHGLEYKARSRQIDVIAGKTASVELRLERVCDMRSMGWVAGDLHVHMIHGEQQRQTSYEDVALTCAANGLDFVSVCQEYVGAGKLDLAGYQEKCRQASHNGFNMFLGGERPQNLLGHQVLLGCSDPFAISEEPPYFKGAHTIHEQGGVVAYVHPLRYYPGKQYGGQWLDFPGNNLARGLIFDAFAGPSFDGLSVLSDEPANADAHRLWFNLLNRGCFVPALADSDACFDRPMLGLKTPGFWNTFFYIGQKTEASPPAVANAMRSGATMATTGPLLAFNIDGQISGATLPLDGKTVEVTIRAWYPQHAFSLETEDAKTGQPSGVARVELIRNGEVMKQWEPKTTSASLTHEIKEVEPCWYAARAYGVDERWQVALASPIYFSDEPVKAKREPMTTLVRGRVYDFRSGKECKGEVTIRRYGKLLRAFEAEGQFQVRMPIDAEIKVDTEGARPQTKNLLMDYGPIHHFLWYLESRDLGKAETLERFELLARQVDLEFPIGHRLPGCMIAADLEAPIELAGIQVVRGPAATTDGTVAVAAVLTDVEQIAPGDTMHVAAVFRDEGQAGKCGPYVIEARGFDPARPTVFEPLKKFGSVERSWDKAADLGDGYKLVAGEIKLPDWVKPGPDAIVDLSVRARQGNGDAAFIGLAIPLGKTRRALTLSNSWPTMPLSWPDRSYGVGPLKICNRQGRKGQPVSDYRQLRLAVDVAGKKLDLLPAQLGRGCADADEAVFAGHYFDQVLSEESKRAKPEPIRKQPKIVWRDDVPLIDATRQQK